MALGREEALALLALYGVIRRRPEALLAGVLVMAAWLGGDWVGSGDPLHGGQLARAAGIADANSGNHDAPTGLALVSLLVIAPQLIALAFHGAIDAYKNGDRLLPSLLAAAVIWTALDVSLLAVGYPLPPRFLLPAAAAAAPAAAAGARALTRRRQRAT
jgi:hypothetical protein